MIFKQKAIMRTMKSNVAYGRINNLNRQKWQSKESPSYSSWHKDFLSPISQPPTARSLKITTHVFMVHTLHEDQLPVSSLGMRLVLKGSAELLNGHISVKNSIVRSTAEIQEQSRIRNKEALTISAYWYGQRRWVKKTLFWNPTPIFSPQVTCQSSCK